METAVMTEKRLNVLIVISLITLGALLRVLPHPANFAPVAAIAIFGGAMLPRRYGILAPLAAMVVSDMVIGFHNLIPVTWGSYILIALVSGIWLKKRTLTRGITLALSASIFFYTVTNFAVWATTGMYAHTVSGLSSCYIMALPFFRNTLLSDMLFTASLFGLYWVANYAGQRAMNSYGSSKN